MGEFWQIIHDSPKLRPSKLVLTINSISADLFISQTVFGCQTFPPPNLPAIISAIQYLTVIIIKYLCHNICV